MVMYSLPPDKGPTRRWVPRQDPFRDILLRFQTEGVGWDRLGHPPLDPGLIGNTKDGAKDLG